MEVAFGRGGRPRPCREDKHVRTGYGLRGHEKRIVEAFDTNGIDRILLGDDVYDPPAWLADELGPLLDFLESVGGQAACGEAGLAPERIAAATAAALANAPDDGDLEAVQAALFTRYLTDRMPEFDPGGQFAAAKGPMLSVLEPLITLLGKCEKATLTRAGLNDALTTFRSDRKSTRLNSSH